MARKHNPGFRPRAAFHLPQTPALAVGTQLTLRRSAEDEQEKAIARNPIAMQYVARYGTAASQPRVRYEAYAGGWQDAYEVFKTVYASLPVYPETDGWVSPA